MNKKLSLFWGSMRSNESIAKIKKMKPIWNAKYRQSEKGFFQDLFYDLKRRCNPNSYHVVKQKKKLHINNGIRDRDHLLELWEKQKELLGGPFCMYTGVELTRKKSNGKGHKTPRTKTNISIDRIDPSLPYQEDNIVFCSWEFNNRKGAILPEDCKKILKVWEEKDEN